MIARDDPERRAQWRYGIAHRMTTSTGHPGKTGETNDWLKAAASKYAGEFREEIKMQPFKFLYWDDIRRPWSSTDVLKESSLRYL